MQAFYQLPFERFERYCPYGTPEDVAEFLAPYVDAGCTEFNLIPQSPDHDQAIAGVAAVKKTTGTDMTDSLVIASRFCGPPDSGNGGYVCGLIAGYLDGPAEVTLRKPPPLETPLTVERDGDGSVRVRDGHTLIAEATRSPDGPALQLPDPVSVQQARSAGAGRICGYTPNCTHFPPVLYAGQTAPR